MFSIALILLPDFALILFGLVLRRHFEYSAEFWRHLERLVYYVMFPSLLFRAVARTELALFSAVDMLLVGVGFTMAGVVASYMARYFFGADQRALASSIQCGFRFNTYVGLAIIDRLSASDNINRISDLSIRRDERSGGGQGYQTVLTVTYFEVAP